MRLALTARHAHPATNPYLIPPPARGAPVCQVAQDSEHAVGVADLDADSGCHVVGPGPLTGDGEHLDARCSKGGPGILRRRVRE